LNEINLQHQNIAMRLSTDQVQAIRRTAHRVLGTDARVSVFGSMAQDDRKGGDIDLFFETNAPLANRAKVLCQLHGALTMALGDRKIDVILKDANTPPAPIFEIAQRTGVLL
jgi:predicted nucleotidyltransferase